eukprot:3097123-Amphidinium_carterae.1
MSERTMGRHRGSSVTVLVATTHCVFIVSCVLVFVSTCGLVLRVDVKTEGTVRNKVATQLDTLLSLNCKRPDDWTEFGR